MSNIFFPVRENATLSAPVGIKRRLQSAPDNLFTPLTGKKFHTPLQSGRKALGAVNKKITALPSVNGQDKKITQEKPEIKQLPQNKLEDYPDIERFIPYDPLEFETFTVPEDLVQFSHIALQGLACFPQSPFLPELLETPMSPLRIHQPSAELDAFLQTIDELTVDLPPEFD